MEEKTEPIPSGEPMRFVLAVAAMIAYFGMIRIISISAQGHDPWGLRDNPWTLAVGPLALILGNMTAWLPRSKLPMPHIFALVSGVITGALMLVFFDPVLQYPNIPHDISEQLVSLRIMIIGSALFLLPMFLRAFQETVAQSRVTGTQ